MCVFGHAIVAVRVRECGERVRVAVVYRSCMHNIDLITVHKGSCETRTGMRVRTGGRQHCGVQCSTLAGLTPAAERSGVTLGILPMSQVRIVESGRVGLNMGRSTHGVGNLGSRDLRKGKPLANSYQNQGVWSKASQQG
jgi:hypothetical protein